MTRIISIDRRKPLAEEPRTGHNRWHPDIEPIVEVERGRRRDARDPRRLRRLSHVPLDRRGPREPPPLGAIHPLTGPVDVKGARPGDLLEIEFRDIAPQPWAFSAIIPGLGYLRDVMTTPFLVHWTIANGWATSPQLPGIRIPGAPFMGVSGVAPSRARSRRGRRARPTSRRAAGSRSRRTRAARSRPGAARPPRAPHAPAARERGQLRRQAADARSRLFLPVAVDGALSRPATATSPRAMARSA